MKKLKRQKVEDGAYRILDEAGNEVGRIVEMGNRWYRWHVIPTDRTIRGWDTETLSGGIDDLARLIP